MKASMREYQKLFQEEGLNYEAMLPQMEDAKKGNITEKVKGLKNFLNIALFCFFSMEDLERGISIDDCVAVFSFLPGGDKDFIRQLFSIMYPPLGDGKILQVFLKGQDSRDRLKVAFQSRDPKPGDLSYGEKSRDLREFEAFLRRIMRPTNTKHRKRR